MSNPKIAPRAGLTIEEFMAHDVGPADDDEPPAVTVRAEAIIAFAQASLDGWPDEHQLATLNLMYTAMRETQGGKKSQALAAIEVWMVHRETADPLDLMRDLTEADYRFHDIPFSDDEVAMLRGGVVGPKLALAKLACRRGALGFATGDDETAAKKLINSASKKHRNKAG